jgi:hypothetical protein|tara:strand:+ start:117 stop:608 length:492 start_codon:yes stop_codon:yes gene_type:complete
MSKMRGGVAQRRNRIRYIVHLTGDERHELEQLVRRGRAAGWKIRRAQALLKCDRGDDGPGWSDARIADAFGMTTRSLENWRKQAVDPRGRGPLSLLERKKRDGSKQCKLDGAGEAKLTQLACSRPPEGHARWTLQLLADTLVALEVVDSISDETVRRTMKKTI